MTTPGFALKADGTAYFKGRLDSSQATFGAWTLNEQAFFITANSRIKLDAAAEQIQVLDSNGSVRFTANTELTLPSPAGVQVTGASPNAGTDALGRVTITPTATVIVDETSFNGNNNFSYSGSYHLLGAFTASANGGQHNIRYTWNPSSAYSSGRVYASGDANSSLDISLVLTPENSNTIVAYGTSDGASAYGTMYEDGDFSSTGFGYRSYFASGFTDSLTDPKTYTVSATLTANTVYKIKLLVSFNLDVGDTQYYPYFESSDGSVYYEETGDSARVVIEAVSAGTIVNGGGFQTAAGAGKFLKHATVPDTTGIFTYIEGGLSTDKHYHKNIGTNIGYNVGGYPMVKGYGRWTMNSAPTGVPAATSMYSMGGVITSLVAGASQGRYTVNYALTTSDNSTLSTITPSVFVQGTRINDQDNECTFDYGKRSGNDTFTTIHTQDNNVDTLNNMDELSMMVVM
jgi:hypothetical protein